MKTVFRLLAAGVLVVLLGICLFGFVATYEPMPTMQRWIWRTVYGLVGAVCMIGVVRPLRCQWRWFKR